MDEVQKSRRGFASMSEKLKREISSKGGRAVHAQGKGRQFTKEEAAAAGRKGGLASRGGRGKLPPETQMIDEK